MEELTLGILVFQYWNGMEYWNIGTESGSGGNPCRGEVGGSLAWCIGAQVKWGGHLCRRAAYHEVAEASGVRRSSIWESSLAEGVRA